MRGLAIQELLRDGRPTRAEISAFLASRRFPVVEGSYATFVYHGRADAVKIRHWIYGLPSTRAFERVAGTSLWYLIEELPEGSRIEYKLEVEKGGKRSLILDPLNSQLARDPFGANSVCQASGYRTPEWTLHDPEARPGELREVSVPSRAFGGERPLTLYLPARLRPRRRYPLLVVHDGADYVRYANLKIVLDNLIHRLEIPPLVAALTQSPNRLVEYAGHEVHGRFLTDDLVPWLQRRFPLQEAASGRCLMGASFGAVASLHAAWKTPGFYGRLLLQSGSFAFTDIGESERGPAFVPVVELMNRFRDAAGRPAERMFVSCGVYESLIYENRSLVPVLQRSGVRVRYVEARDGHNWENWRDRLREGLSWLFPGPLWMVYE